MRCGENLGLLWDFDVRWRWFRNIVGVVRSLALIFFLLARRKTDGIKEQKHIFEGPGLMIVTRGGPSLNVSRHSAGT